MKKVLVIGGLTATGKSDLAIELAKKFNGEILSVDSVAVYKQLTIASAKPSLTQQKEITHYGIDIADVSKPISVKEFVDYAHQAINTISEKGKLPILVGGSGLYLKAILYDYSFLNETQDEAKSEWAENIDNATLHNMLANIDVQQASMIHPNNRKRLIRALTIAKRHNISKTDLINKQSKSLQYDAFLVFLDCDRDVLWQRINQRVDKMIAQGLEQEIVEASKIADWSASSMSAIGVKEWKEYFNQTQDYAMIVDQIKTKTRQFSKRQRTWFKHQFDGIWIDSQNQQDIQKLLKRIEQWKVHSTE